MDAVLIVEDNAELCDVIDFYLQKSGQFSVSIAHNAEDALELVATESFDAILLDIMLPGIDGIAFCQKIRKSLYCPVIFISCFDDDETIVCAMGMGGDDYLVKPFSCSVLQAHLEANIRRSRMLRPSTQALQSDEIVLDPVTHAVTKRDAEVVLSLTEYSILHYMMQRSGEFLPFEKLYEDVWGVPGCGDLRTLFTHITNLKKKIEDNPKNPTHIVTYQRSGYIFH